MAADSRATPETPRGNVRPGVRGYALTAAATLTIVLAGLLVVVDARRDDKNLSISAPEESAPPVQPESTPARGDATAKLKDLSTRVGQRFEQPEEGRFRYVQRRIWLRKEGAETVEDIRLWWASDHSGRSVTSMMTTSGVARASVERWFVAGELYLPESAPSTDPGKLADQLATIQGAELGAAARLRAVATMNDFYDLDPAQRAGVLKLLADTPGITYRGQYLDQVNRGGLAFSADTRDGAGVTRDILVFHETTGILLAHEVTRIPYSQTEAPSMVSHTAYLDRARTATATD